MDPLILILILILASSIFRSFLFLHSEQLKSPSTLDALSTELQVPGRFLPGCNRHGYLRSPLRPKLENGFFATNVSTIGQSFPHHPEEIVELLQDGDSVSATLTSSVRFHSPVPPTPVRLQWSPQQEFLASQNLFRSSVIHLFN